MNSTLKQVIHYPETNSVEATWVDSKDVVIKCHSYADVQMQMFRDDVAELGGDITEYEELIASVEANIKPVEPEPVPVPQVVSKAQGLLELYARGLLEQIETYMLTASVPEMIAWKNIQQFEYDSPMLNGLLGQFGLTQGDKDQLFIAAAARVI